ncbi:XdhC family protein [Acetobacterium paludosum]|uniref:XdhC family protein n=1 Tax=Acetobacterium paludosum TaxID=52693 RepID=A0A923HTW4_9FIRM|nr:XdhC family protein [Acetobacterium paludosum]MBC3887185.1 XdhC family protein [Acetobacterium paludosum]
MEILEAQLKAKKAGIPYALLTVTETEGTSPCKVGKKMLLLKDGTTFGTVGGGEFERQAIEEAKQAIKDRKSFYKRYTHIPTYEETGLGCTFNASLFVEVVSPRLPLVICNGGHVGNAVLHFAKLLQFETILIDTRSPDLIQDKIELADRFISCEIFETGILEADIPDGAYYICCASTHTQDKSALKGALQKNFEYVGMLGSTKKTVEMYKQLEEEGIDRALLEQVHTPVGLDIGNASPEEVAFSILAEILMVKNGGTGKSCKERRCKPTPNKKF